MTYSLASKIASKNKIDLIKWQYQLYDHTRKPYREIFITSSWTFTKIHVYIDMKPVLLTVDDEPQVLIAIEHDLKLRYGNRFRILQASTGKKGLDLTKQLKLSNELVALFLVDQMMPDMKGVEFIQHTMNIFPEAKRILLTLYEESQAVITSINNVKIDYYLTKPWDPPEEHLYPVLDDLLDDWWASIRPPFEGIKVIGVRWSPRSHELKEFLARNGIPYQWLDIEGDQEARRLVSIANSTKSGKSSNSSVDTNTVAPGGISTPTASSSSEPSSLHLPLVIFPDGTWIAEPTNSQIAEKIGLKTRAQMAFYDLIIIGGGPSGLAAAVYGASEGLHTLVIEKQAPGGQAGASSDIENYLGFPSGLSGASLARRAVAQALRFGAEILDPQEVASIRSDGQYRIAKLGDGTEIRCHTMVIASGVTYRRLEDVEGIDKLTGAGVYYGASMAEALDYQGQDVYIVGGANSAGQAAIHFSKYAKHVTLLVRDNSLSKKMSQYLIHQINETDNINVWLDSAITEVKGENKLEAITVTNLVTGEQGTVPAAGLFIYIGAEPHTEWLDKTVRRDAHGFILTGQDLIQNELQRPQDWSLDRQPFLLETNVPSIFTAGDVRHGSIKRIAAAVGEGSTAIQLVHQYLMKV
jgi:thioredoxin reductase (NADPH)